MVKEHQNTVRNRVGQGDTQFGRLHAPPHTVYKWMQNLWTENLKFGKLQMGVGRIQMATRSLERECSGKRTNDMER